MRSKEEITSDGSIKDLLILEVLLDIRDILKPIPEAPLYVSDKPPKPRKKRKKKIQ